MDENKVFDLVGIGLGPSNLSTAALLHKCQDIHVIFLEQKEKFSWHPHMLFEFSKINVAFYKDLVSLIDPTNPYSFMNYLVVNNKQYSFFNSDIKRVSRKDFEKYFQWVADQIPYFLFSCQVYGIEHFEAEGLFKVTSSQGEFLAKNILIGTGIAIKLPDWVSSNDDSIFHGYNYLSNQRKVAGENVLIAGGGQSGAEVIYSLLEDENNLPSQIHWVTNKGYPVILDENPFANEIYTPAFAEFFYHLDNRKKDEFCSLLRDTSDGIHGSLLVKIYQRIFFLNKTKNLPIKIRLIPFSKLSNIIENKVNTSKQIKRFKTVVTGLINKDINNIDKVIFCTGFTCQSPVLLDNLKSFYGDKIIIQKDFSIRSIKESKNRIYINNGAKEFFGPADPNLSLISWRSAVIINSLLNKKIYHLSNDTQMIEWGHEEVNDDSMV